MISQEIWRAFSYNPEMNETSCLLILSEQASISGIFDGNNSCDASGCFFAVKNCPQMVSN